ncbi:MAG: SMC-Scp complex subunit ScpB [Patescibacteria group bacterium]
MNLEAKIEAILFAAAKPFSVRRLAELTDEAPKDIEAAITAMLESLNDAESGVMLQRNGSEVELVTRPEAAEVVAQVVKAEAQGELSRPSLEALTILAYRGPLTRPELEQVRGVQSSMILRNLQLRGLVEEREDVRLGQPTYAVTFAFLNHLGVASIEELPEYESLRGSAAVSDVLAQLESSVDSIEELPTQSV